MEKKEEADH